MFSIKIHLFECRNQGVYKVWKLFIQKISTVDTIPFRWKPQMALCLKVAKVKCYRFTLQLKQKVQSSNKLLMLSSYSSIMSHEYPACDTFHEHFIFIKRKILYFNSWWSKLTTHKIEFVVTDQLFIYGLNVKRYLKQNECPKCKLKILSCYNIWQIICQLEIYQNEIAFL